MIFSGVFMLSNGTALFHYYDILAWDIVMLIFKSILKSESPKAVCIFVEFSSGQ